MAKNKWMEQLSKLVGALNEYTNPFAKIIDSPSPSFNFIFGNTHGIPLGYTAIFWGPSEGGKSLITNLMTGKLHQNDPEAIVLKYDTERRTLVQLTKEKATICGIDLNRLKVCQTNSPSEIFDVIKKDVNAMCQEGAPIKMIIIDSISNIEGRRTENRGSINDMQMGDKALTLTEGIDMLLPVIRNNNIALIIISQERAELDQLEIRRHKKVKMQVPKKVVHFAEYVVYVEPNRNKDGTTDILGNELLGNDFTDMVGNSDKSVMKIKATMQKNNLGPKGRTAQFTFDLNKGVVNQHEEIYRLGVNRGIISHPNRMIYTYQGVDYKGEVATLEAIKNSEDMQKSIIKELKERDLAGKFAEQDAVIAEELNKIPDIE